MSWYQLKGSTFLKVSNVTLLFFILLCVLSYICFTPPLRPAGQANEQTQHSRYTPAKPRIEITGLHYDMNFKGKKGLEVKADRFTIRKKKLGFIRFGLAQEAFFQNAEISFLNHNLIKELNAANQVEPHPLLSLNKILTASQAKKLSGLVMAPVSIIFYDDKNKVSHIRATKGSVRITTGEKHLRTTKLIFHPEREEIYIPGNFMLEVNGKKKTGGQIATDITLSSVTL